MNGYVYFTFMVNFMTGGQKCKVKYDIGQGSPQIPRPVAALPPAPALSGDTKKIPREAMASMPAFKIPDPNCPKAMEYSNLGTHISAMRKFFWRSNADFSMFHYFQSDLPIHRHQPSLSTDRKSKLGRRMAKIRIGDNRYFAQLWPYWRLFQSVSRRSWRIPFEIVQ